MASAMSERAPLAGRRLLVIGHAERRQMNDLPVHDQGGPGQLGRGEPNVLSEAGRLVGR